MFTYTFFPEHISTSVAMKCAQQKSMDPQNFIWGIDL